jgi:hypothetical protein
VKSQEEQLPRCGRRTRPPARPRATSRPRRTPRSPTCGGQLADTETAKTDQQTILERQVAEAVENFKDRDAKLIAARKAIEDASASRTRRREPAHAPGRARAAS